jgi:hypothetical protein
VSAWLVAISPTRFWALIERSINRLCADCGTAASGPGSTNLRCSEADLQAALLVCLALDPKPLGDSLEIRHPVPPEERRRIDARSSDLRERPVI